MRNFIYLIIVKVLLMKALKKKINILSNYINETKNCVTGKDIIFTLYFTVVNGF